MKMHIEITESYTTGICTVWQVDHHRLGRRFTIYDPEVHSFPLPILCFPKGLATLSESTPTCSSLIAVDPVPPNPLFTFPRSSLPTRLSIKKTYGVYLQSTS